MDTRLFEQLHKEGLIADGSLVKVSAAEKDAPISVHWDLRTLLYFSILLLSGGLCILLYKNIDTIGHATIVGLIGVLATLCLVYCFRFSSPYSNAQVTSPNLWFDYILLLGCLLMLGFVGYLQYQYHVFGMRWGLATFIPMLILFFLAYRFDHKGVLSLAITNLGAWMGIAVAPMQLIRGADFSDDNLIINGIVLGVLLHLFYWLSGRVQVKAHFASVYKNFGVHVLFISLLAAMFHFDSTYFLWLLVLLCVAAYYVFTAMAQASFYFLVVAALYGYVGISYMVVRFLTKINLDEGVLYLLFFYFILSGIGMVVLLMRYNKQLKQNDRLQ